VQSESTSDEPTVVSEDACDVDIGFELTSPEQHLFSPVRHNGPAAHGRRLELCDGLKDQEEEELMSDEEVEHLLDEILSEKDSAVLMEEGVVSQVSDGSQLTGADAQTDLDEDFSVKDFFQGKSKWKLAFQVITGFVVLLSIALVVSFFFRPVVERLATAYVEQFSFFGVGLGVMIFDAVPFIPGEPFILMGITGGINMWVVFAASAIGSVLSAPLAWLVSAYSLHYSARFRRAMHRYKIAPLLRRHASLCVAAAAVLPVWDFTCTNYCAGALRIPIRDICVGALARAPRLLLTCLVFNYGWSALR
jgi:uncharacterized membrane protein YdjX (TVP38/TMEM64 family)